jgi:DNA-directed RNA polymerase specialized sigma24 family protein
MKKTIKSITNKAENDVLSTSDIARKEEIAKLLHPVAIKTAHKISRKYQNGAYASIFTFEEIMGISEEIIAQITTQVIKNQVDEQGMYSYLTHSIENRSKDLYKAQVKTVKRGSNIKMVHDDVFSIEMEGSLINSPELILMQKKHIEDGLSFLKNFDTDKAPLSTILKLYLESFTVQEIQEKLHIPISTLERYKKKGVDILAKFYKNEGLSFDYIVPSDDNLSFLKGDASKNEKHDVMVIKEICYNKNDCFALVNIIGALKGTEGIKKCVLDSFSFKSEDELNIFLNSFNKDSEKIYQNLYLDKELKLKELEKNAA